MAATTKKGGTGLGWSDDKLWAFARTVPKVCEDSAVGKQMKRTKIGRRLKRHFVLSGLRSQFACTLKSTKRQKDNRRRNERGKVTISKSWLAMRRDCTHFNAFKKRIKILRLTVHFGAKEFHCMTLVEVSQEGSSLVIYMTLATAKIIILVISSSMKRCSRF